jgi:hypothetical protein
MAVYAGNGVLVLTEGLEHPAGKCLLARAFLPVVARANNVFCENGSIS